MARLLHSVRPVGTLSDEFEQALRYSAAGCAFSSLVHSVFFFFFRRNNTSLQEDLLELKAEEEGKKKKKELGFTIGIDINSRTNNDCSAQWRRFA